MDKLLPGYDASLSSDIAQGEIRRRQPQSIDKCLHEHEHCGTRRYGSGHVMAPAPPDRACTEQSHNLNFESWVTSIGQ